MPPSSNSAGADDWRTCYLRQARADYAVLNVLINSPDVPLCQKLHYMQMTTEKLAKGLLTAPGAPAYRFTHDAFVGFMRVARSNAEVRRVCAYQEVYKGPNFADYVNRLLPLAQAIEDLSPEGGPHPNPEYPWDDGSGQPISPLDYSFSALQIGIDPKMNKLISFVEACLSLN